MTSPFPAVTTVIIICLIHVLLKQSPIIKLSGNKTNHIVFFLDPCALGLTLGRVIGSFSVDCGEGQDFDLEFGGIQTL